MVRRRGRVTIREVAAKAGVSITAVSHALNGKGSLSDKTRERVRAAALELGYEADVLARAMRNKPMGAVGLIIRPLDELGDYRPQGVDFFTRFSGSAAHAAADRGLGLMLVPDAAHVEWSPLARSLDGFIITDPTVDDPTLRRLEGKDIPVVTVGRVPKSTASGQWVSTDDFGNATKLLELLHARGASDLVLVAGTDDNAWNLDAIGALQRWQNSTGATARVERVREAEGEQGGRRIARQLIEVGIPEAVFCLTGRHAAGLCSALTEAGIRVPEDILVAALSDSEQTRSAGITAIDMQPDQLALAAVDLIDCLVREDPQASQINQSIIVGEMLERASTIPNASASPQ